MIPTDYQLFLDLDGVLVDFDAGVIRATGLSPAALHPKQMWPVLAKTPGFYDKLDWMEDGRELWNAVRSFNPVILTGVPRGKWAEGQKRLWCARELGISVPVITGMSREKAELACTWLKGKNYLNRKHLLVDDRLHFREIWEETGGIFIDHRTTRETLLRIKELGFPV